MDVSVLVAWMPAIVAGIAFIGTIVARLLPDRAKREPAWNELASENRELRGELGDLRNAFDSFQREFRAYRTRTDRKVDAFVNIARDAAIQWPDTHEGPLFDPEDLAALEDTEVPARWRGRVRALPGLA